MSLRSWRQRRANERCNRDHWTAFTTTDANVTVTAPVSETYADLFDRACRTPRDGLIAVTTSELDSLFGLGHRHHPATLLGRNALVVDLPPEGQPR